MQHWRKSFSSSLTKFTVDVASCLHFLLDLFEHWFVGSQNEISLMLLYCTTDSLLFLSDLFCEPSQYEWMREKFLFLFHDRGADDELMLPQLIYGLLKSLAVLGIVRIIVTRNCLMLDFIKNGTKNEKEVLSLSEFGIHHLFFPVRMATLKGLLYVLQAFTSDEGLTLAITLNEYILSNFMLTSKDFHTLFDISEFDSVIPQIIYSFIPSFLSAFFSPMDVMNKVIQQLLDVHVTQPIIYMNILIKVVMTPA
ncbi:unnamed protein product [Soboliphyme baturini]|uniref:FPL domain-containing protein n=1 Tax=Soboliphyme baturini TaxID=241478 RepID=A0A183IRE2_9BILA|nr:unnamed protein product [Soboliphyme baturini]